MANRNETFIKNYGGLFKQLEKAGGLNAVASCSQAILESGAGTSNCAKNNNNLFGIKWIPSFGEAAKGTMVPKNEWNGSPQYYRKFSSVEECIRYHDKMFSPSVTSHKAYKEGYQYRQSDPQKFLKTIGPTYCGSDYANKVIDIMPGTKATFNKLGITDNTPINDTSSSGGSSSGTSWASAVQTIGNFYTSNKLPYNQTQSVFCSLVNKNVREDCSGYVSACLWKFGVNIAMSTSYGFTASSGSLYNTLSSAGFTQMDYSFANLQPYDIITYNGHVEIYAGNKQSYAWGSAHTSLPTPMANKPYTKIWRLTSQTPTDSSSGTSNNNSQLEMMSQEQNDVSVYGEDFDTFGDMSKYADLTDIYGDHDYDKTLDDPVWKNTTSTENGKKLEDVTKTVKADNGKVYPPVLVQKMKPSIAISEHSHQFQNPQDKSEDKGLLGADGSGSGSTQDNFSV